MKKACADCGTVRYAAGGLPEGQYRCHPCRRLRPQPHQVITRTCKYCPGTFRTRRATGRQCCDACLELKPYEQKPLRGYIHCSACGKRQRRGPGVLLDGEYTCQPCRRIARPMSYRALERSGDPVQLPLAIRTRPRRLGWNHACAVAELKRKHVDGSPCEWCGRPMWIRRVDNWDYDPYSRDRNSGILQGDHTLARSLHDDEVPPDRLLHGECNRQRADGRNDHLAWVNHQTPCNATTFEQRYVV